jgi:hypothetical protein
VITKVLGQGARLLVALVVCAGISGGSATLASAAGPPEIHASYVEGVTATSAILHGQINPNGLSTTFRAEYITEAAYQANLSAIPPRDGFSGAVLTSVKGVGAASTDVPVFQQLSGLVPATTYHYRLVATNSAGPTLGPDRRFGTEEPTNVVKVLDGRGWEMVSPIDKNGGAIQGFGDNFGGGVLQAAADGNTVTYSSADSFGGAPQGAPAASQYLARRGAGGWASENITTPLLSGSYGDNPSGVPYQLFSADLTRGLLTNGQRCRGSDGECPVVNPPLPGTGAPSGYRNYYLRNDLSGGFQSLLNGAAVDETTLGPEQFELEFAAASPDLSHVVLSSCAALTENATEKTTAGGCDPEAQNLYEWSGSGLTLINLRPGETQGTPSATVASQAAVSADGSRVYWVGEESPGPAKGIYLREGSQTKLLGGSAGGTFQTASVDGRFAFFITASGHLDRYDATTGASTDLTPGGGVIGVLGASQDGSHVYYLSGSGLFLWNGGTTTEVAEAAAAGDYPPATGTARVSPDGSHLAFMSSAELTGYENNGVSEVFLYGPPPSGGGPRLTCVSCNPTGERPQGGSSIPGAIANGKGEGSTQVYKPHALSSDGSRVFFDSDDVLVSTDSNKRQDVYEWEGAGAGDCTREGGCVALVSSGRSPEPSTFIDASANGSDAFFLTDSSLVPTDPGSFDVYDAREGGGFPVPPTPIPCDGDACQALPEAPEDPTPGTLVRNAGNPPLQFTKPKTKKKHHHKKKHHKKAGTKRGGGK